MMKHCFTSLLLLLACSLVHADRYQTLLTAKHLALTTKKGVTYLYLVSNDSTVMLRLNDTNIVVENDTFAVADIQSMRLKVIPRFVLDEDSTTYGRNYAISHALLALRSTIKPGQWNSIVIPIELTGKQIRETFGEEASVAQVKTLTNGENLSVDYETLNLDTNEPVMLANHHYLLRPSREPDLALSIVSQTFGTVRPKGPFYLVSDASMAVKQSPRVQTVRSDDGSIMLSQQGSYVIRDNSSTANGMLDAGYYYMNDQGHFEQSEAAFPLKAFRSWFLPLTKDLPPIHFFINGVSEDLTGIVDVSRPSAEAPRTIYNLQGCRLSTSSRPGIYIINGKKVLVK